MVWTSLWSLLQDILTCRWTRSWSSALGASGRVVSQGIRLTAQRPDGYRHDMARRRVSTRASKASFAISHPESVRPGDPDYDLVRRRRRQSHYAVPVRAIA